MTSIHFNMQELENYAQNTKTNAQDHIVLWQDFIDCLQDKNHNLHQYVTDEIISLSDDKTQLQINCDEQHPLFTKIDRELHDKFHPSHFEFTNFIAAKIIVKYSF